MRKLPVLKDATEMLVCGEDLGVMPACVPPVMLWIGIADGAGIEGRFPK